MLKYVHKSELLYLWIFDLEHLSIAQIVANKLGYLADM